MRTTGRGYFVRLVIVRSDKEMLGKWKSDDAEFGLELQTERDWICIGNRERRVE
jgi:hypothetical protein